jgi:penicillin-insensitive murein endopeptidase
VRAFSLAALAAALSACAPLPSPLAPELEGSVGLPHGGVLVGGVEMRKAGEGYRFLRDDDRHYALPRFARALARAAARVSRERPGGELCIGDLSAPHGGALPPHLSHRSGRDADLLFYLATLEGAPVRSPGFLPVGRDGLAWDPAGKRFLRLDVEREWLLVKALLEDEEARVQWIFVHDDVRRTLLAWARARGESTDLQWRAALVMAQPRPGGLHDDHLHVRTACTAEDRARGCQPFGPTRPWLDSAPPTPEPEDDGVLALELARPLEPIGAGGAP